MGSDIDLYFLMSETAVSLHSRRNEVDDGRRGCDLCEKNQILFMQVGVSKVLTIR